MNEGTQILDNVIYSYTTKNGVTCYTPSSSFAHSRAMTHGTEHVYIVKLSTEEKN